MRLRQESQEVEQQLNFVVQQINELEVFSKNLEDLQNQKEKEILASLGKGVYVKAKRNGEEKIFVEVGAGVVLKKSILETREIIEGQIKKFKNARIQLSQQLEGYASDFNEMLNQVNSLK